VVDDDPEPQFIPLDPSPRPAASVPDVLALPPFDEYYLSYDDRTRVCAPDDAVRVGPGKNGMVRAVILDRGRVAGAWTPGRAAAGVDAVEPFGLLDPAALDAAVGRYAAFAGI
jgi:hypothetical protein